LLRISPDDDLQTRATSGLVFEGKQRQQMWQAAAADGSSRQDSKQACMRAEKGSIPVCARTCMQKPTTCPRRDRVALVCPDRHVTPATKIDQCTQKARARHAHKKCFVLDHPVSRPDKICSLPTTISAGSSNARVMLIKNKPGSHPTVEGQVHPDWRDSVY